MYSVRNTKQDRGTKLERGLPSHALFLEEICCWALKVLYAQVAEESEAIRLATKKDGGTRQLMSTRVAWQRKALIGPLRMIYWPAKEELPHANKFIL